MKNLWLLLLLVSIRPIHAQLFGGQIKSPRAIISQLNCANATVSATVYSTVAINGVNVTIPITASSGGTYLSQAYSSTGVTGLTLTSGYGMIPAGSSNLVLTLSGTANTAGNAVFNLAIGGQTCSITVVVVSWANQYPANSVFCAAGATAIVDVTNPTTGLTWMDRNLGASQVATSSTDQNAYGDLYQWGRRADGHQCRTSPTTATLSSVDQPAHGNFILAPNAPYDWRSPQNTNLWQGVNGVNNPCPSGYRLPTETELNNERLSWGSNNGAGAFAAPLKWTLAGYRDVSPGSLHQVGSNGYYWSSTVSGTYSRFLIFTSFAATMNDNSRAVGFSVRCVKETVGAVGTLNCNGATQSGNIISGQSASNVTASVPYTGGNGGFYAAQSIASTGVTGLTATLSQGLFANGAGSVTYTITGTPASAGTATFAISLGGQSCNLALTVTTLAAQYPANSVFCAAGATAVVDVTNPTTGKTWMDRNLGATQVAISSTDPNAYGDLYQWGRRADGHQCRTSSTTATLSSVDQPAHGNFILAPNAPTDWRSPQNNNLWIGVNGVNNPCPSGFRLPTEAEIDLERASWSSNDFIGAFNSPLKLSMGGDRYASNGGLNIVGQIGIYSTSTIAASQSRYLYFFSGAAYMNSYNRGHGLSVRCIKEIVGALGALNCGGSTTAGNLFSGSAANNVSASVPYTSGNGGFHAAQNVASMGVTGLTASLAAGTLANGAGSVTYTITGTPASSGTASFAIALGGQSCSFTVSVAAAQPQYPANTVNCNGVVTIVNDVTNPSTGQIWMDRNLGASQVATSSTDQNAYGDLYQWGRRADGHQCRTSGTTFSLSSIDQPAHSLYIITGTQIPRDWRSPQNNNLWQGINGFNNPCPLGYRIPTLSEINSIITAGSSLSTAFNSILKLTASGRRNPHDGSISNVAELGALWTSTINGGHSNHVSYGVTLTTGYRGYGLSVRCIKN